MPKGKNVKLSVNLPFFVCEFEFEIEIENLEPHMPLPTIPWTLHPVVLSMINSGLQ